MRAKRAFLLLSGGLDSTWCAFWAKKHFDEVHAVTIEYGQRHVIEVESSLKIAELSKVTSHEVVSLGRVLHGSSPLVSGAEMPTYTHSEDGDILPTFVPMRNLFFLTLLANRAYKDANNYDNYLIYGASSSEQSYPDTTHGFVEKAVEAINSAGNVKLDIMAPLLFRKKEESVIEAVRDMDNAYYALAFTTTSYSGEYPPITQDHATVLRKESFELARLPDPLILRAYLEGRVVLPTTSNYNVAIKYIAHSLGEEAITLESMCNYIVSEFRSGRTL